MRTPSHRGGTDCPVAQGPDRLPAVEIPARRKRPESWIVRHGSLVVDGGENGGENGGLWWFMVVYGDINDENGGL